MNSKVIKPRPVQPTQTTTKLKCQNCFLIRKPYFKNPWKLDWKSKRTFAIGLPHMVQGVRWMIGSNLGAA